MNHLIVSYGYLAVALVVGGESLGLPLPGESILILAAVYAGHTHRLSVWVIFIVAAAAAIVGDNIGFWLGDRGGYRLVRRFGHYVRIDEAKIKVGRYVFDRHGGKVVFFGRFVSILRTYAAFLAGTNRMEWRKFLAYNTTGGILWAGIYTFGAYLAGDALRRATGTIDLVLGGAALVVAAAALLALRRHAGKLTTRAEAAHPGPLEERGAKRGTPR